MIVQAPELQEDEREVLQSIRELQAELRDRLAEPGGWDGTLKRTALANAARCSSGMAGYTTSLDDVFAIMDGERTFDAAATSAQALAGCLDSLSCALQLAVDDATEVELGLIRSLHFMALKHDPSKHPGQWRRGAIGVPNMSSGEIVYEAPPRDDVPELMAELVAYLGDSAEPTPIKAAMAHLNLVLIHPFSDGNGRTARCLQTLLLDGDPGLVPGYAGIEEFLRRNAEAYRDRLTEVAGESWRPERDARPWIRFCLHAHHAQAKAMLRHRDEIEQLWNACLALAARNRLPERCAAGLMDAARGLRIRRPGYQTAVAIATERATSKPTATRDLLAMVDRGLLEPIRERSRRLYVASRDTRKTWDAIQAEPFLEDGDPFTRR